MIRYECMYIMAYRFYKLINISRYKSINWEIIIEFHITFINKQDKIEVEYRQ
jgi:hypothetical protein